MNAIQPSRIADYAQQQNPREEYARIVLVSAAITDLWCPNDRRYPITHDSGAVYYGPWIVVYKKSATFGRDGRNWHWLHNEYDFTEHTFDYRSGSCASLGEALNEIDECEDDS